MELRLETPTTTSTTTTSITTTSLELNPLVRKHEQNSLLIPAVYPYFYNIRERKYVYNIREKAQLQMTNVAAN